ncbi:hypothetical protein F5X99DRAFT_405563 [Biscogniauxia marginata]|nr:hypothetical protein F5X99DRAFT_405563 [Biscogniauxia marginata]
MWPMDFRETSAINITWTTTYEGVNLYFYQQGKVADSTQIATNLATGWYQWEVKTADTDLTDPFVFRIVNAFDTEEEMLGGGFWSTSFFILRDASSSTTTSSVSYSTSSSSEPLATLTTNPSVTFLPTEATQPPPFKDVGLSPGTMAGISVASVVAAVVVLAAAYIWHRKRKASTLHQSTIVSELPLPANEEQKVTSHEHHS